MKNQRKEPTKSVANTAPKNDGSHQKQTQRRSETEGVPQKQRNHHHNNNNNNNNNNNHNKVREKTSSRRHGSIPCGKRTDFGYDKDFDKKYTIGKLLGHGQFGYTYVATDKFNSDRVAVKKIDKSKMVLPIAMEDVKREVKILKALAGHENVVQFHNAFEDENYVYIVMELCEGGELLDRILAKKDSRYTEKDAAVLVRQMLKFAAQCHLHGLVHRDMKPEIFLFKSPKEDSSLKATNFGRSDFIKPGRKFTDIVGSAYYVAPEVLKRKSGPESDVWSIGVITYILLCGRRPFWDKTEDGIFKEVLRNMPDFQRNPWPTISTGAKDFVKKLLVKDPHTRLTAAQALCMYLGEAVQDWREIVTYFSYPIKNRDYSRWPDKPEGRRKVAQEYSDKLMGLACKLLGVLSEAMGLQTEALTKACVDMDQKVVVNYYPKCPQPDFTLGLKRHTDPGTITLLLQDHVGGLQATRDGGKTWITVEPISGAFVVNLGDHGHYLSNGRFKNADHQAVVNSDYSRLSIATFQNLAPEATVYPFAIREGEKSILEEPITFAEMYRKKMSKDLELARLKKLAKEQQQKQEELEKAKLESKPIEEIFA